MDEFIHLSAGHIRDIHDLIIQDQPGLPGARPDLTPESLVHRVLNRVAYDPHTYRSIETVAALYAEAIARGHVFNDANKRTALTCMLIFISINGYTFTIQSEEMLADKIVDVAEGRLEHIAFGRWLKHHIS
jgi:death-on-curing protein